MSSTKLQFHALTGLRFLLAFWVVIFHESVPEGSLYHLVAKLPGVVSNLAHTGYVAVSVFFVLSGFILAYNYPLETSWPRRSVVRFAVARFARIYPVYCLGLFLMLAPSAYNWLRSTQRPSVHDLKSLGLGFLLLQSWIPDFALTWNFPGWSLSDEAFFYACFPFLGIAIWKCARGRNVLVLAAATWGMALLVPIALTLRGSYGSAAEHGLQFAGATGAPVFWVNAACFNPVLRLPEFVMGILACRAYQSWRINLTGRGYLLYIPASLGAFAVLSQAGHLPYLPTANGLLLPVIACGIIGLALGGGAVPAFLSFPFLRLLGNASYAVYILHRPILLWLSFNAWARFLPKQLSGPSYFAFYALVLIATSYAVYIGFELPAQRYLRGSAKSKSSQSAG